LDAPGHFIAGGRRVTELHAGELFPPAAVIDITERARGRMVSVVPRTGPAYPEQSVAKRSSCCVPAARRAS